MRPVQCNLAFMPSAKIGAGKAIPSLREEINPLKTKRRPLYLKNQFVPRSKHFSSRL